MSFQQGQLINVQKQSVTIMDQKTGLKQSDADVKHRPRVASYCRVSSEEELQLGSLENQIIHYTNYIRSRPEWIYAGVYSDKGKSGTDMSKRTGFNRLVRNAMNGDIDIILCKSISRFARNVVDTLDTIRQLSEKDVQIIFEREKLNTKDISSSLLIKILATFAEEESKNTSENIEWAMNKRFERGEVRLGRLFGYRVSKDKEWEIVEREARIVQEAFALFLKGYGYAYIAKHFIKKGYKKRSGEIDWNSLNISTMLKNERYKGDVLSRKTCTLDFRSHRSVINDGRKPQYYFENHHEVIISKEDFQKAQDLMIQKRIESKREPIRKTPMSSRIICAGCGRNFHRYSSKMMKRKWRCSFNCLSKLLCEAKPIEEETIQELLIDGFKKRYEMDNRKNDGLLIKQLIKELSSAEAVREREQNLLRVELEKYLIAENKAVLNNEDTTELKGKRVEVEERIAVKTKLWEDFDKDHHFREASLKRLKALKGSDKAINQILDISFIRAWVIHITVESPILFFIRWVDGAETVVGEKGGH